MRHEVPEDVVRPEDEPPIERQVSARRAVAPLGALALRLRVSYERAAEAAPAATDRAYDGGGRGWAHAAGLDAGARRLRACGRVERAPDGGVDRRRVRDPRRAGARVAARRRSCCAAASPPGGTPAVNQRTERVRTDFFAVPPRHAICSLGSSFRLDPELDAPRRRVPRLLTADAPVRVLLGLDPAC